MSLFAFFASLSSLLTAMADAGPDAPSGQVVQRLIVHDEMILRVPVRPVPLGKRFEWTEHKGPKCLASRSIAGALLSGPSSIDFVLADRSRVRAKMDDDCPALDFYGGFYLEPEDDRICAKRDEIRSRIGGSCRIERFRTLKAKAKH